MFLMYRSTPYSKLLLLCLSQDCKKLIHVRGAVKLSINNFLIDLKVN